jgi:DNA polymerase-3 subunit epsilon
VFVPSGKTVAAFLKSAEAESFRSQRSGLAGHRFVASDKDGLARFIHGRNRNETHTFCPYRACFVLGRPSALSPGFHLPRARRTSIRSNRFKTLRFVTILFADFKLLCCVISLLPVRQPTEFRPKQVHTCIMHESRNLTDYPQEVNGYVPGVHPSGNRYWVAQHWSAVYGPVMTGIDLDRRLVFFDIEATGLSSRSDRIVEICLLEAQVDGSRKIHNFRVNPEMPIPAEATKIHGISDADVAACPSFEDIAQTLFDLLHDCDLAGYGILNFDIPLLVEEFLRARLRFSIDDRRIIDVQRIFHKKEPRDLTAALKFYCNEALEGAHGAEADAVATEQVLEGQLKMYNDLPHTVAELDQFCNPREPDWVDRMGRLKWDEDEIRINFGKKKGESLRELVKKDPSYLKWIIRSDFPRDMQDVVRDAIDGIMPARP